MDQISADGGHRSAILRIVWTPRKEAARAVADAMPFIEAAESVHIAMIDPDTGDNAMAKNPAPTWRRRWRAMTCRSPSTHCRAPAKA